jgi:hypothetical protein
MWWWCRGLICFFSAAAMTGNAMCVVIVIADMQVVRRRIPAAGRGAVGQRRAAQPRLRRHIPAADRVESGELHNSLHKNRPDKPMKFSSQLTRFSNLLTIVLLAGALGVLPADLQAAGPEATPPKPVVTQQLFASPDEAIKALRRATEDRDTAALNEVFGAVYQELATGDTVQDANNAQRFAAAMSQGCNPVKEGENKITLEIGTNNWPLPVPLVKVDGQWHFDTVAGKEEIINRHIGKDELHAIGVCRAYVTAQKQYADANPKVGGGAQYAQQFKSTPGKKDGLYWPSAENEPASPFGPLVAEAHAEGYGRNKGAGPHPFHGYFFRILTRQGKAAPDGKMNYMSEGTLAGGFALVAYPEHWDRSGIMTFIVNQDGKVFQHNFGEKTSRVAGAMKEYNPDNKWTLVQDEGILGAVSEK